jgi:hypothetical protein
MESRKNSFDGQYLGKNGGSAIGSREDLSGRVDLAHTESLCGLFGFLARGGLLNGENWPGGGRLVWLGLGMLLVFGIPVVAQTQVPTTEKVAQAGPTDAKGTEAGARDQVRDQQLAGTIRGTVIDRTGAMVAGARVRLTREGQSLGGDEVESDGEGQFTFASIAPGPFQLTAMAEGFATVTFSGTLHSGETCLVPPFTLTVASTETEVRVTMSRIELAEAEIKDEEKQRVFGVVPNFYVTYNHAAVPLTPKQKFELAWKATIDPINFGLTGAVAGIQQATNSFSGYGQGAQGYGKRYGASYAGLVAGTYIGSAILPSLLKQDPRYFYKGTGRVRSRILYAIANSVICKGDNGHWQANYSSILGGLAAGGISNLYYPTTDRGAELTFENTAIGIGTTAAANILQEFIIRRLTPHAPSYAPAAPSAATP